MTLENKDKSAESNKEKIDAAVADKAKISGKNTEALANELNDLTKDENELSKNIQDKLNFRDVTKAGPSDVLKGTAFDQNIEDISKDQAVDSIIKLGLITLEDLKKLSGDEATKKIQTAMFEKINQNPAAKLKMDEFLRIKGDPFGGKIDGKFGARSLFALNLLVNTPPPTPPSEKKLDTQPKLEYKPAPSGYVINVRGDAEDGGYFFAKDKADFVKITSLLGLTGNMMTQENNVGQKDNTGQITYEMSIATLNDYLNNESLGGTFAYRNKITDPKELATKRDEMKQMLGAVYKRDSGNNLQLFAPVSSLSSPTIQVNTGELFVNK